MLVIRIRWVAGSSSVPPTSASAHTTRSSGVEMTEPAAQPHDGLYSLQSSGRSAPAAACACWSAGSAGSVLLAFSKLPYW